MGNTRAIKPGTILNGKYRIEMVLGEGGFGITYRAHDTSINETVAIKEYFPSALGTRDTTASLTNEITIISSASEGAFVKGLKRFADEAANLARFNREQGIVSVKNFFLENSTGYMVMEYVDGTTLKEYLQLRGGKIPCEEVLSMMKPVMDSLDIIHAQGIIHRDISPDNIMVTRNGQLKLIDFGAARYFGNEDEKSLTVMLKQGYAPAEQYRTDGNQGPWTDVYALCATMYKMISGQTPTESIERAVGADNLVSLHELCPEIPESISKVIGKGMSVDADKRWKSIGMLQTELAGNKTKKVIKIVVIIAAVLLIVELAVLLVISQSSKKTADLSEFASETEEDDEETSRDEEYEDDEPGNEREDLDGEEVIEVAEDKILYAHKHAQIRTTPEVQDGNIVRESDFAEEFDVLEYVDDDWVKVTCDGADAYILRDDLVNKDDLETWTKYFEAILSEGNISRMVLEGEYENNGTIVTGGRLVDTDALCGEFVDYDGDGKKELFLETVSSAEYTDNVIIDRIYYTEAENVLWFANENGVKKVESSFGYYNVEGFDWTYDVVADFNRTTEVAKNKFYIYYLNDIDRGVEGYYTVKDSSPSRVDFYMDVLPQHGINMMKGRTEHLYYSADMIEYTGDMDDWYNYENGAWYPWYYLNGQVGQISSCEVNLSDISKLDGFDGIEKEINSVFSSKGYISVGQDGVGLSVKGITNDSCFYNEAGFFVINYIIECDWRYSSDNFTDYLETSWLCDGENINYISGHAMIAYNTGELELVYTSWGKYQNSADDYPVLVESDFSSFKGLDYYKIK